MARVHGLNISSKGNEQQSNNLKSKNRLQLSLQIKTVNAHFQLGSDSILNSHVSELLMIGCFVDFKRYADTTRNMHNKIAESYWDGSISLRKYQKYDTCRIRVDNISLGIGE